MKYKLFIELIQVSVEATNFLSHTPTADEWGELYYISQKHALVGVTFYGVQRLQKQQQCPPEELYLKWMGMAAKIQQWNGRVNQQCVDLQRQLSVEGFRTSILKGQGVANLYSEPLRSLRQSGDIDIWIDAS